MIYLLFTSFVLLLLAVSFFSIEAWPFSAYSMFSSKSSNVSPTVLYLKLQRSSGEQFRWRPKRSFYRKRMDIDLKLAFQNREKPEQLKNKVAHYYELFCAENHSIDNIVSIHLVYEEFASTDQKHEEKSNVIESFRINEIKSNKVY